MRKLFRRYGLSALLFCFALRANAGVVWIDTDLSLGSPLRDVDDGYALLLAFRSPELQIAGISTSYGNGSLRATTRRTRLALDKFGSELPIERGAESAADLGRVTPASQALAKALQRQNLTYVALGPLTNLATLLRLHPECARRITEVIMVGGKSPEAKLGFGPQGTFRIHDANVIKDRAATRAVLRSQIPIFLAPIETSSQLLIVKKDLRGLAESGGAGRYLSKHSGVWLWFWTHFVQARGGPIFDALAVLAAARPDLLTMETRAASFNSAGELIVRPEGRRKVAFCSGFAPQTKAVLLARLSAPPAKSSPVPRDR